MTMVNQTLSAWLRWIGGEPCFRIYGKGRAEAEWRVIEVYATARREIGSGWPPLWSGARTTWTDRVVAVGWDFAEAVLQEQAEAPASRQYPVAVAGGRLRDSKRRLQTGATTVVSASEILAHECGHTWQARRFWLLYLPLVGSVTWFHEGPHLWNYSENQASEVGLFGGIVPKSLCARLARQL